MALASGEEDARWVSLVDISANNLSRALYEEIERSGDLGNRARALSNNVDTIAERCSPERNPNGFKLCQDAARVAVEPLLVIAANAPLHEHRVLAFTALALICFRNCEVAGSTAVSTYFEAAVTAGLKPATEALQQEELLSALQMIQSIAAIVPEAPPILTILPYVATFVSDGDGVYPVFRAVKTAAVEVLLSCSRSNGSRKRIASLVPENIVQVLLKDAADDPTNRYFTIILLFANLCNLEVPASGEPAKTFGEYAKPLWDALGLAADLADCLRASLQGEAWPVTNGAFHSTWKLADTCMLLATANYVAEVSPSVGSLVAIVTQRAARGDVCGAYECQAARSAVVALGRLVDDISAVAIMKDAGAHFIAGLRLMETEAPEAAELFKVLV